MAKRSVARPLGTKLTNVSGLHSRSSISNGWSAGSSNMIHQIFRGRIDRMDKYRTYDWMDQDSDIARALDIISEHCTERDSDHRYFKFHWFTNEAAVEVTELLKAHLDQWSKINRFKQHLFKTVRNMLKYGDWFMFRNPNTFELYDIHPQDVMGAIVDRDSLEVLGWMIRDFRWNVTDLEIDVKDDSINRQVQSLTNGNLVGGSNLGNAINSRLIPAIHILHFSLSEGKLASSGFGRGTGNGTAGMGSVESANPWPFGRSWLDKAHNTFKKRELLEDSIIIHRVQRAPTRLVWYIDVGKMRHDKHTHVVQNFKNELNQKRIPQTIGSNGRGVDSIYNPISQLEDYYIPVSMDQRGSKVEQLDGKPLTDMPDLDYFNKKMASALRVPYAWLQPAGEGGIIPADGRQGVATQEEIEFSRFCARIQTAIIDDFDHEYKLYTKWRGVKVNYADFEINLQPPTDYEESRNRARLLDSINSFKELIGVPFISKRLALKHALGWTDDMIALNEKMVDEETSRGIPAGIDASGAGSFGGPTMGGELPMNGELPPPGEGLEANPEVGVGDTGFSGGANVGDTAMESFSNNYNENLFEEFGDSLDLPNRKHDNNDLGFSIPDDKSFNTNDPVSGKPRLTIKMLQRLRQTHFSKRVDWQKRLAMLNRIYGETEDAGGISGF